MIKHCCYLLGFFSVLAANPQIVTMINEFKTIASGEDEVEFHSTYGGGYSLLNVPVTTIAGTAQIDTDLTLDYDNYLIINAAVLNGPFYLPADSGYIIVNVDFWVRDSIFYPICGSVPPSTASAAKFHAWVGFGIDQYRVEDWYLDNSPTLGLPNDDYPGCKISGTINGNGNPVANASVVAASVDTIYSNPESLFLRRETSTASDGSYSFEYLFPIKYAVSISAVGYESEEDTTPMLRAMQPLTGFDFNLNLAAVNISRDTKCAVIPKISNNPFREDVTVELGSSLLNEKYTVQVFDITCRLVRHLSIHSNHINWNGRDDLGRKVNPGVYFMLLPNRRIKLIKL